MDAADLAFAGVAKQADLVREGEVSSRELVEVYLARIGAIEPRVNAFRVVLAERALAEADQADARRGAGEERPLLGVPMAIKDAVDVAGEVTTYGTGAYGPPAAEDAEIVKRLRAAGAILIGKTHLSELALWPFTESATWGVTRNPWDLDRTSGGSSGGSASAVAAGLVGAGQASDGGGSIRIPAAACGLFGLKPQRGRVSLAPDAEHWHGLTSYGVLTRGVLDTALLLDVVAGPGPGDADRPPPPARPFAATARERPPRLRIAVSLKPPVPVPVGDEAREAVEGTAALLRSLGHEVRDHDPAWGAIGNSLVPRYLRGGHDDARRMARPDRLERRTRRLARMGAAIHPGVLARARAAEAGHTARLNEVFDEHDVLLTPVVPRPPAELGRFEGHGALATMVGISIGSVPFTTPWNTTGQPAASVPAGFTSGLPLAVQLVGRRNDEATVLSLAAEIESERPWAHRRPPLGAGTYS